MLPPPSSHDAPDIERVRAMVEARLLGVPAEPVRVGRFIVLERIGAGGMGEVYAGYDTELDRKVAIKLLHRSITAVRERVVREAQAMARLAHPNVVTVFEIGEYGDRAFVAMEFVKGSTLRAWCASAPRSWREILACYVQAGQGLAAAHAAGIVHRDFKPDNVLVGDDGRVRVVDFGLARAVSSASEAEHDGARTLSSGDPSATPLTRDGARVGTPAYMALEQIRGETVDAKSDQFAFCVALWEALHGERPFSGATLADIAAAIVRGDPRPPAGARVPGWIASALRRGLSADAHARHRDMSELLRALADDPSGRRRKAAMVASVVAVPLVLWAGVELRDRARARACAEEAAAIDDSWNPDVESAVRAGLIASGAGNAETTAQKVIPRVTEQAERWRSLRATSCNAQYEVGVDISAYARTTACLDEGRAALDTLVTLFTAADRDVVQSAVGSIGSCRASKTVPRRPRPQSRTPRARSRARSSPM